MWSALLAEKGFDGPPEPLAGVQGFYHALGETPDLAVVTEGLGEGWEILATSYKPYPCGFVIHPVLDCVLDWRRDHPAAEVDACRGARQSAAQRPHRPARYLDGARSAGQRAACGRGRLVTGKAGLDQFSDACVRDPKVLALRSKVEVLRDSAFSTIAAAVEITTADGTIHKLSQSAARGSDANPMSDGDLEDKLRVAAARLGSAARHRAADRCDLGARQERRCFEAGALAVPLA